MVKIKLFPILLAVLAGCMAPMTPLVNGAEVMMGHSASLVRDLEAARSSVAGLASLSITVLDLENAGIRPSIVQAHANEETKAALVNDIGTDPTTGEVVSAFAGLTDDTALLFTSTQPLVCATFADCVTNANLLCSTFLGGEIASVTTPTDGVCPIVCGKNGVLGAARVTC